MIRAGARSLSLLVVLSLAATAFAVESDPTYTALRAARPDGRTIALTNFTFERDVLRFTLNGKLHLLKPVDGKTPGGVFIGQGSYELTPAMANEQRQLAIYADDKSLERLVDQFDSAIFLGSALIAAAEKSGGPVAGTPDPSALGKFEDYLKHQRRKVKSNLHIRVLQEMIDGDREPLFLAWLNGKKYPPAFVAVDPREEEQTALIVIHDDKGGLWYSSRYKSEIQKGLAEVKKPLVDPEHYLIDATFKGAEIIATSTMTFTPYADVRVLPVNLMAKLRISEAMWSPAVDEPEWQPVAVIQEDKDEDASAAVVFPSPAKADLMYLLKVTYAGKEVLTNAGDGNWSVGARLSWYPNVAIFDDYATYELRFRIPQKLQVVAIGHEVENKVEGDQRVSVWKTETPARVAGFNYGRFKKLTQTDKDSGMTVEVFTNPGTPDILREINAYLEMAAMEEGGPSFVKIDTAELAKAAMADGINTARVGNAFFGPLLHKKVAITQQSEWGFGQSWPSLIYLPYLAFLNGTQRNALGMGAAVKEAVDSIGMHEFAHQWWGHQIGWKSYRDQWISEGFAEFTAGLVLQNTGGWPRYNHFFEQHRKTILEKPRGAIMPNDQAGPITQGQRLSTWQNPSAYFAITYSKGPYILHMLRMAMWDRQSGDAAFIAMMTDFVKSYSGKNPSTRDFQKIVEKHATPSLKITKDGKLDWFFNQWVHGTAIPKYESKFAVQDIGGGKYKVTGSITQSEVPENFAVVVPMYVHFDKTNYAKFGATMIVGSTTRPVDFEIALPKKPQKFSINANHDVLAR
ncbi:MAG TPA: M1 family aminopeptidase [Thermoanaerobaculia bacterium]|nr:M1 family aminopeptidase [Thermoanaerobaculia bacterium]